MPLINTRHYFCILVSALIMSASATAADTEEAIAQCARIASVVDRILCLENALRRASGDSNRDSDTDGVSPLEAITVEPASGAADLAVADTKSEVTTEVRDVEEPARQEVAPEISPAVSLSSTASPANELGAEQVAKRNDSNDPTAIRVNANIVAFDVVGTGRLRFRLDNDQIWQQIGDDNMNLTRKLRGADIIPVEMWRSRWGGYRMRIKSIDRIVRVKRLK